jgi:hypothetical protein
LPGRPGRPGGCAQSGRYTRCGQHTQSGRHSECQRRPCRHGRPKPSRPEPRRREPSLRGPDQRGGGGRDGGSGGSDRGGIAFRGEAASLGAHCLQAAHRDPDQDGCAARELDWAERLRERHRAEHGADQRLEVQESSRDIGRHPALPEGEQRRRQYRPG